MNPTKISKKCNSSVQSGVLLLSIFLAQVCSISATPALNTSSPPVDASQIPEPPKPPQPVVTQLQQFEQPEACNQFVESSANEFHSPGYPSEYGDSLDCIKIISAGEGEVIRLRFVEHFHLEPDEQCRYDFLEVRDGQFGYSTLIGKLCGTTPPTVLESSGRHLWLRFHSDQDIHYQGFRAFFEFVPSTLARPDLDDCSFHLTHLEANITSADNITEEILVNRRDLSIQHLDCTWIIVAPKNQRIYLQFKAFALERANDCSFNFVEIYGMKTELYSKEGRLHQFCGSETKPIFSRNNTLHLRFFTALSYESSDIGIGFKTKLHVYYNFYRDLSDAKDTKDQESPELEKCNEPEEFDCTDNTCIDKRLTCNGQANCKQGNDEDRVKCKSNKAAFHMTMDLIVIAFIGCFLAAGMCSGLILNICRKLRQDKIELEEIRANLHKSRDSMGSTSAKSKPKSTSNSEHDLKSISIPDLKPTPTVTVQPEEIKTKPPPRNMSENSSSAESKDTVIYRPNYKEPEQKSIAFGFTFKPMKASPSPQTPSEKQTEIPYSPPPPYNPAISKSQLPKLSKKQVQVYDEPPPETPEEINVIEVRDCACQTRESFTEKYLRDVYFGSPRYYKPSSRSSPTVPAVVPQPPSKRAPLARGEALEVVDVPRRHMRKIPKGPADVLMYPKSPGSIASVDASTGSLELLSELDEAEAETEEKKQESEDEEEDDEDDEDEPKPKRSIVSGYSELN